MTERKWLACSSGVELSEYWDARWTERKARFLLLACCRRHEEHLAHASVREAIAALAAHYADPLAPNQPFNGRRYRTLYDRVDEYTDTGLPDPVFGIGCGVMVAVEPRSVMKRHNHAFQWLVFSCLHDISNSLGRRAGAAEHKAQAALVREVLGNPFRPVAFAPEWRTDTVRALAQQMYATEDFGAMPILADALQDAGCDNDDILNHCREQKTGKRATAPSVVHVRGCWVLDLVLGKE